MSWVFRGSGNGWRIYARQRDNPDGDEIHPFKLMAGLAVSVVILLFLAYFIPPLSKFNTYS
jgi:hypothetical protein